MVTAQIATIPARKASLKVCVESLLPQVDKIKVMLNDYDGIRAMSGQIPDFLVHDKIQTVFCDNKLLDGYKFLDADQNSGHVLICDDDIAYPPDFVEVMLDAQRRAGRAVISIMGKNLLPIPFESYALGQHEFFRAFEYHSRTYEVNLIGMCGAIYHTDYCKINHTDMLVSDSDVCMSAYCSQRNIKMYVIRHKADWCKDLSYLLPDDTETMWKLNKHEKRDFQITDFINRNIKNLGHEYNYLWENESN